MRIPKCPLPTPEEMKDGERPDWITQVREYELITPLFGGGVDPAEADPVTVVRATEIRGHLRFWWRATQGGRFDGDLESMKKAEDDLFGSAGGNDKGGPSLVQVVLTKWNSTGVDKPFEVLAGKSRYGPKPTVKPRNGSLVPAYAAFPLQPEQKNAQIGMNTKGVVVGVSFSIEIAFPKSHQMEIEAALWAWETFGGIGARTRRGFGALKLNKLVVSGMEKQLSQTKSDQVERSLRELLATHVVEGKCPSNVPHLSRNLVFRTTSVCASANEAWRALIHKLEGFRQYRKNKDGRLDRFGKSCWPEPNAIRRLQGKSRGMTNRGDGKFPRAYFGLPIGFHFPQDNLPDATLRGRKVDDKEIERLASPLILRPFPCAGGQAVGLAAILETPQLPPNGLELKELREKVTADLSSEDARHIEPLRGNPNVLLAFLNYLQEKTR